MAFPVARDLFPLPRDLFDGCDVIGRNEKWFRQGLRSLSQLGTRGCSAPTVSAASQIQKAVFNRLAAKFSSVPERPSECTLASARAQIFGQKKSYGSDAVPSTVVNYRRGRVSLPKVVAGVTDITDHLAASTLSRLRLRPQYDCDERGVNLPELERCKSALDPFLRRNLKSYGRFLGDILFRGLIEVGTAIEEVGLFLFAKRTGFRNV